MFIRCEMFKHVREVPDGLAERIVAQLTTLPQEAWFAENRHPDHKLLSFGMVQEHRRNQKLRPGPARPSFCDAAMHRRGCSWSVYGVPEYI